MTPEEKAALIAAQTQILAIEIQVMLAENAEREEQGYSPANGPEQWEALRRIWEPVLGYNSVIEFFQS